MNLDEMLESVDKKVKEIDTITREREKLDKFKSELKNVSDLLTEVEHEFKSSVREIYRRKCESLKEKLKNVCECKNIEFIDKSNGIISLSYKTYLGFTINLSDTTKYISRTEDGKKTLGFKIDYSISEEDTDHEFTSGNVSELDKIQALIAYKEIRIKYFNDQLHKLNDLIIHEKIIFDSGNAKAIYSEEDIIATMFG